MSSPMPLIARPGRPLAGTIRGPGDRALSLRALILGALAVGRTSIRGGAEGDDVRHLATALRALGATVAHHADGVWTVDGVGVGGLTEPAEVLDLGGSVAAAQLLMGLVASHPLTAILAGDAALGRRSFVRLTQPLERLGAQFIGRRGGFLPLTVVGATVPMPIEHRLAVACADAKAALLLAALNTPGLVSLTEPRSSGDAMEQLLRRFGARVEIEPAADGARLIRVEGQPELRPTTLDLPADFEAAAAPLLAALGGAGADVTLLEVGLGPHAAGLITILQDMGAQIEILNPRPVGDVPAGDIRVRSSRLKGLDVPAARMAGLADAAQFLAFAAAQAKGTTVLPTLGDGARAVALARGLSACGVGVTLEDDTLVIAGSGGRVPGGARLPADLDVDLAMGFLALGFNAAAPVEVADGAAVERDFPGFAGLIRGLGADLAQGAA